MTLVFSLSYDFNLLVSHDPRSYYLARQEIFRILEECGDDNPKISRTIAKGVTGVKTSLNNREVIALLKEKFASQRNIFRFTAKWTPIDLWCDASNLEPLKRALSSLTDKILPGEKWMMHVEKRRYVTHHKAEIIKELASAIQEKVDLRNPDKIVWIEIVGKQAGISIITPSEVFSLYRAMIANS